MDTPHDIPVRSARDRIIDLLEIGDTYPLTDLNVVEHELTTVVQRTLHDLADFVPKAPA